MAAIACQPVICANGQGSSEETQKPLQPVYTDEVAYAKERDDARILNSMYGHHNGLSRELQKGAELMGE
jgi:hypothetical protein